MGDFLDRLPASVEPKARIVFEAIGFCESMLQVSLSRLMALADFVALRREHRMHFQPAERYGAFVDAWSVIDQLHNLRKLVDMPELIDKELVKPFITATEVTTLLRNEMDHLPTKITNISRKKSNTLPILGVIEFVYQPDPPVDTENRPVLDTIVLLGSMSHHKWSVTLGKNLKPPTRLPCDAFVLRAFGYAISLTEAGRAATHVRSMLSVFLEQNFTDQLKERELQGKNVDALKDMPPTPETLVCRATAPAPFEGYRAYLERTRV